MEDLIEFAKKKLKEIESRKAIVRSNLETYRRLAQRDTANKEKMIAERRETMRKERCSRHQIELACKYIEDNYKKTAMEKEHEDAIAMYENNLKDLEKEKQIYTYFIESHKE